MLLHLKPDQKLEMYKKGQFAFSPPPVPTALWTDLDWVSYIDTHGKWMSDMDMAMWRADGFGQPYCAWPFKPYQPPSHIFH